MSEEAVGSNIDDPHKLLTEERLKQAYRYWQGMPLSDQKIDVLSCFAWIDHLRTELNTARAEREALRDSLLNIGIENSVNRSLTKLIEEQERLHDLLDNLRPLVAAIEMHCPCGARPESPSTHPHVMSCPVAKVVELLTHSDASAKEG